MPIIWCVDAPDNYWGGVACQPAIRVGELMGVPGRSGRAPTNRSKPMWRRMRQSTRPLDGQDRYILIDAFASGTASRKTTNLGRKALEQVKWCLAQ